MGEIGKNPKKDQPLNDGLGDNDTRRRKNIAGHLGNEIPKRGAGFGTTELIKPDRKKSSRGWGE